MFFSSVSYGETLKQIFNPAFGGGDFYTRLDSTTLPAGSTQYIQSTLFPSTTTQTFNVQQGKFGILGYMMTDANGCKWDVTISTNGALTTTLNSCSGQSMGLLLLLTYP